MTRSMRCTACVAGALALVVFAGAFPGNEARASSGKPLHSAIANTDSALSYREVDTAHSVLSGTTVTQSVSNVYDQRHNRERDHSHFTIVHPGGKTQSYSVDVVMLNNRTYFRSTLDQAGWRMQAGYGHTDPVSGTRWHRSPLVFSFLEHMPIATQGRAADGTFHVRFRVQPSSTVSSTGFVDVWVSAGGTPYIVQYAENLSGVVQGKQGSQSDVTRLSGFNQPVSISAPKLGT